MNKLEQGFIAARLLELGIALKLNTSVQSIAADSVVTQCVYSKAGAAMQADHALPFKREVTRIFAE